MSVTTGGIWGYVLVVWGIVLSVSSGYLSNILLVVGGIYFFEKFFWESNSRELSKTRNNLLTDKEQTHYNYGLHP